MIKFLDLKAINERFRAEMDAAAKRVLDSGWYLLGKECEAFESEFAAYCGVKHAIGCANGLDALKLVIRAMRSSRRRIPTSRRSSPSVRTVRRRFWSSRISTLT